MPWDARDTMSLRSDFVLFASQDGANVAPSTNTTTAALVSFAGAVASSHIPVVSPCPHLVTTLNRRQIS